MDIFARSSVESEELLSVPPTPAQVKVSTRVSIGFHVVDLAQDITTGTNTEHCCLVFQTWFEEESLCLYNNISQK